MSLSKELSQNRRQSYDERICDDLSELLLQYLSLEDKLWYECVSKQFQKTVFEKHYVFDDLFLDFLFRENRFGSLPIVRRIHYFICFESILKKCPNLKTIVLRHEKLFALNLKRVTNYYKSYKSYKSYKNYKNLLEIHLHFNVQIVCQSVIKTQEFIWFDVYCQI